MSEEPEEDPFTAVGITPPDALHALLRPAQMDHTTACVVLVSAAVLLSIFKLVKGSDVEPPVAPDVFKLLLIGSAVVSVGIAALVLALSPRRVFLGMAPNSLRLRSGDVLSPRQLHAFRVGTAFVVGLVGFMLYLLTWDTPVLIAFTAGNLVLLLIITPTKKGWEGLAEPPRRVSDKRAA